MVPKATTSPDGHTEPTITVVSDGQAPTTIGAIARSHEEVHVVAPSHDTMAQVLGGAVAVVSDAQKAADLLRNIAAARSAETVIRFALVTPARSIGPVLDALEAFDLDMVELLDDAPLLHLWRVANRPGNAREWVRRLTQDPAPAETPVPAPTEVPANPPRNSPAPSVRLARRIATRMSRSPKLAAVGAAAFLVLVTLLALIAFPGGVAAVSLTVLLGVLATSVMAGHALVLRRLERAERSIAGAQSGPLASLDRRIAAVEARLKQLRKTVSVATGTVATASLATNELLRQLQTERGLPNAINEPQTNTADLTTLASDLLQQGKRQDAALQDIARVAGASLEALGRKAGTWDITRLHNDLLNDQQAMAQLIARYQPAAPLPPVSGWAMNPTGLLWLADRVERTRPGLVLECGSGTSTVWLAMALSRNGAGRLVSIEHDPDFAERTRQMLERHGLAEWVDLRCCPLVEVTTPRGEFRWYDLEPESVGRLDLLVVDGPPGATGPHARYPAFPVLAGRLAPGATVVLDDTGRREEQEVLDLWVEDDPQLNNLGEVARGVVALVRADG